jgi:D-alanyl-D-alanine dipeptidase
VIFDGYRPWSVTKLFWEVTPEDKRKFVANPQTGSRHNRGCAVDLSMFDLKTGKLVEMPTDFDDFTDKASPNYDGASEPQKKNRDLLRQMMEAEGFTVNKTSGGISIIKTGKTTRFTTSLSRKSETLT